MKDARQLIMRDIQNRKIANTEFNEEMLSKETCVKIIGFYEARKLDALSILSNPFNNHLKDKQKFILELAVEQAKIEDHIWNAFGNLEFPLFLKACRYYGLLGKTDNKELSRNAMVIKNNLEKESYNQLSNPRLSKSSSLPGFNK